MTSIKSCLLLLALGIATLHQSGAAVIPINNHSFENPILPDGQYTINQMPGWIGLDSWFHVANPANDWFAGTSAGSSLPNPIDGFNIAGINTGTRIYQDLAAVLEGDATYTLTMLTGHRIGVPFGSPTVSLIAGGQVLAQAIPIAPVESRFSMFQLTYSSPHSGPMIGQSLRIEIQSSGESAQPWIDDLNLVVVPEPSTITLGILGGIVTLILVRSPKSSTQL